MTPELATKWVEALRSGDYKQAKSILYDKEENAYCCLGVLYKIVCGRNPAQGREKLSNEDLKIPSKYQLDDQEEDWFIQMNDTVGYDFDDIADEIEAKYIHL